MDLSKNHYKTFDELYPYCYKVASIVGLISLKIFGCEESRSENYAINLGVAFQLTNILRDISSDARQGRVYLPEEDLAKFSFTRESFLSAVLEKTPNKLGALSSLIGYECRRAEHYYKKAKENFLPKKVPD